MDNKDRQENGVLIVEKSRTIKLNKKKTVNNVIEDKDQQPQNE